MKRIEIIITLTFIFLLFNNCKKNDEVSDDKTPSEYKSCNNIENIDSIPSTSNYVTSTKTNDGGIIILENKNNIYKVIKIDNDGNFQWEKEFNEINGNFTGITTSNDAVYITTNVDVNNVSEYATTGWEPFGFYLTNGIENCQPLYGWDDKYSSIFQNYVDGTTYLTKIDYNGNFIFSKEFEGNTINNNYDKGLVQSLNNGDIALLTFDYYGNVPYEYNIDSTSSSHPFIDTVKYYTDKNTAHLYHLDSEGNIIWKKTFENIQQHYFSLLEYYPLNNYYVLTNSTRILINLYSKILIYDYDGNLITTLNEEHSCDYEIYFTELLKDYVIFHQENKTNEYTTVTDINGNLIDNNFQITLYLNKPFNNNQYIFYNNDSKEFIVCDINNNIIKSKKIEYVESALIFKDIIPACDNSFYTILKGAINDGTLTGGGSYYIIRKEIFY